MDSLPFKILPQLQEKFPEVEFLVKDPNEEWENLPEELTIIDTTVGAKKVTVFDNLEKFAGTPTVSMHDFDALSNLRYLQKLGKLKKVKIIGIPPEMEEKKIIQSISQILNGNP